MPSEVFNPIENLDLYCRTCEKVMPAVLDRAVAGSGKILNRSSVFEYCCTKCVKSICLSGTDLLEKQERSSEEKSKPRTYSPKDIFFIGEEIFHEKFSEKGLVVGKENSAIGKILVSFPKNGLMKLVQGL
ncbi:MAG: hypothetical protein LBI42_07105 [Chitinispirillales bacterium]|jgi:hypothetical protein|nr:hypothetical protein [Chitinispirillales bacterium]